MPVPKLELSSSKTPISEGADPLTRARSRLIVALDAPDAKAAGDIVDRLEGACQWFKVGLELFVAGGPAVLHPLLDRGYKVFLDLKFHDIPNTVAGAVRSASAMGVQLLTVHASGGLAMLEASRKALEGVSNAPKLLAVTVLTSMDSAQMHSVGLDREPAEQVGLLAKMGLEAGFRGFVCSPQEVASLRKLTGPEGTLVIPGIRPAGAGLADQKRIATPAKALELGASYLVVGRPITQAAEPWKAAETILAEMATVL